MSQLEKITEEMQVQFKAINDNFAIVVLGVDGTITRVNDNFLDIFGYQLNEVVGTDHCNFWPPAKVVSGECDQFWQEIVVGGVQVLSINRRKKSGEIVVVEATYIPIRDANNEVLQVLVSIVDATERNKTELSWRGQFEAINRSQAIIEFDVNGIVLNANENFLKTLKYSLEEIKGKHHGIFCEEAYINSLEYQVFWDELRAGKYQAGQFKRLSKYDKVVWIQAVYSPIYDLDGRIEKIVKYAQDITKEKELSLYYQGQIEAIGKSQAVVEFNAEGIVIDANEIFLRTLGYSLDEIQGKPHSIFCEEELVHTLEYKIFWEDLKAGKYQAGQFKRITKSGIAIWIQASYNPIYGVDGKVTKIIKYAHNITEEKELSLYNQGQIEAISRSQAVIEFNRNGVVLNANDNFLRVFSYTLEEVKGKHHSIFCDKDYVDSDEYKKFWVQLKNGQYNSGQFKRFDKNGKIIWIQASYSPIYGIDGKVIKVIKFATDITEEQGKSLYYQGQIEAISKSQAVIEFDINGVILNANNNFLATLGYTLEDVKGRHHSLFCDKAYANSKEYKAFWDDLKEGIYKDGQFKRIHKNGEIVFIRATYNPIYGIDGKVVSVVKYAHDITESEKLNLFNKGKLDAIYRSQAYIEFDLDGKIVDANDYYLKIFKYSNLEEIKGKSADIFSDEDVLDTDAYRKWKRELLNGKYHVGQFKLFDKYGGTVWLQAAYNPIYGVDGKIVRVIQFSSDITAEKEKELYYKGQMEAMAKSQAVIEFDVSGIILNANDNFLNVMEYQIEEIRGKHHSILCDEEYANSKEYKRFWRDLKEGKYFAGEYKRISKNGKSVWLSATYNPIYGNDGEVVKVVKFALDMTVQRELGLYYKGQIDAISKSQAIVEFTPTGEVLDANDNFLNIFSYHLDEIQGKNHRIFCEEELANSELHERVWKELENGKFHAGQYKRVDKYGQTLWMQATYNPIYGIDGQVIKVIEFAHNITKDKELSLYYRGQIEAIKKSQAVVEFDINGVVLDANTNFLNTFCYSLDEVKYKHHSMFCDREYTNSEEYKEFWDLLKSGGYHSGQFKRINKEGKLVWIQATYNPIYGIDGQVTKIVKYAHDITEAQEALLYSQGQVEAINKAQAVVEFDMNGTVLNANKNFLEAMGYDLDEIRGKHHSMFCAKEFITSSKYHDFWEKLQNGMHDSGKYLRIGKGGKKVWIRATYTPILNIEGKPIRVLKYAQDITELETIKLDKLTGLYNTGKLISDIEPNEINNLAIFDSNEFVAISDFYGFLAGDTLIVQFSKILRKLVKKDFSLYRLHDDKFAILNHTLSREDFEYEIDMIRLQTSSISIDARVNNLNLNLTCGIAYGDTDQIINFAKTAHNHAKNNGKVMVTYSKDLNIEEQFQNKIFWSKKIKSALKEDRIIINQQPIYNNQTKEIEKHEVLVRALERDQSLVYPNQFLNVAKTSKQYLNITRVVIKKSFETFEALPFSFSINITIEDILDAELQEYLFKNIKKYNVGKKLIVEIVESEQIKEYGPVVAFIKRLKEYGGRLAIDDFGSGYSNFNHLLELDADYVKIDGAIISKICENNYSSEIVKSIVSFCKNMGIKTIAEFVSSKEILERVTELGVDYSQGYYIGKPHETILTEFIEQMQ